MAKFINRLKSRVDSNILCYRLAETVNKMRMWSCNLVDYDSAFSTGSFSIVFNGHFLFIASTTAIGWTIVFFDVLNSRCLCMLIELILINIRLVIFITGCSFWSHSTEVITISEYHFPALRSSLIHHFPSIIFLLIRETRMRV